MFGFKKKGPQLTGLWDIHCHLVPGVDDGAADLRASMALLEAEYRDGVRNIIVTPHNRLHMFENEEADILAAYEQFRQAAKAAYPDLALYLGCELHQRSEMVDMIRAREQFRLAGGNCVLLEFSTWDDARRIRKRVYTLAANGYTPIVAHVERYQNLTSDMALAEDLVGLGAYLQVNADSLLGKDGMAARRFSHRLLEQGLLHFVGSDAHDLKYRPPRLGVCAAYLARQYGEECPRRLLIENPKEIIFAGEENGEQSAASE